MNENEKSFDPFSGFKQAMEDLHKKINISPVFENIKILPIESIIGSKYTTLLSNIRKTASSFNNIEKIVKETFNNLSIPKPLMPEIPMSEKSNHGNSFAYIEQEILEKKEMQDKIDILIQELKEIKEILKDIKERKEN